MRMTSEATRALFTLRAYAPCRARANAHGARAEAPRATARAYGDERCALWRDMRALQRARESAAAQQRASATQSAYARGGASARRWHTRH